MVNRLELIGNNLFSNKRYIRRFSLYLLRIFAYMQTSICIFSFFSGAGFLDLGFEKAGFKVDFVNEISPSFIKAYKYARSCMGIEEPRFGYSKDVNEFLLNRSSELKQYIQIEHQEGSLIGFIGGPPCPDFSIAGKQRGREGDNGKLSQSYVDLICEQKPDFFLFENVKGIWRTSKHRAYYEELKAKLSEDFYIKDRLCNALEFGAPQDRDRMILFGIKKEVAHDRNLHIESFNWDAYRLYDINSIKSMPWPGVEPFKKDSIKKSPEGIMESLTTEYWFKKNEVESHPNSSCFFTPKAGLIRMQTIPEGDVSKKSYKRLHRWRFSPTACYGNNEVHLHPYKERRISAAEALAIQSLPKEFCFPLDMSLSDIFKSIGNGVPYVLANGIAKTIRSFINSED